MEARFFQSSRSVNLREPIFSVHLVSEFPLLDPLNLVLFNANFTSISPETRWNLKMIKKNRKKKWNAEQFTNESQKKKAKDLTSSFSLPHIVVRDGIAKGKFPCSEYDLAGFRIWIPRDLKMFELAFLSKLKLVSSILFEWIECLILSRNLRLALGSSNLKSAEIQCLLNVVPSHLTAFC
jgi:hypothetical protein